MTTSRANHSVTSTLDWVCKHCPERIEALLQALNLELPELAAAKAAVAANDLHKACRALLDYYRNCDSGQWLRHEPVNPGIGTDPMAEKVAQAVFPLPGGEAQIPKLPNGRFDWSYIPPKDGGREWVYGINRHDYMSNVLTAFYATGNRKYIRCLDEQLLDWCLQVERPTKPGDACPWGTVLEPGHRAKVWPAVFYGLQQAHEFSPATRILMLSQALDHAQFLHEFYSGGSNWIVTEMAGLLSIACAWPEFREAAVWRDVALRLMQSELRAQVYPDGVQKELSSNYQMAVLWHLSHFMATVRGAELDLDPDFVTLLESMWNYLAYSLGPNGFAPQNGDSDRCRPMTESQIIKPLDTVQPILDAAALYDRLDWTYIATNGSDGMKPAGLPSAPFPWGGQLIMRSSWEADAHWAFFDIGSWGILHQHNDALHLSVTAYGRDLLVDSGRYTYENYLAESGTWRSYFVNSAAHNVILVDGLVQADGPPLAVRPVPDEHAVITPEYDYAQGTFAAGFTDVATASARLKAILWREGPLPKVDSDVIHTRAVLYLRGRCWIVVDHIETDRPRRISPLWHFHPDCTVERQGQSVATVDCNLGNLHIQPLRPLTWDIELVKGREGPDFQGWYSPEMGVRIPNTCATYTADIQGSQTFGWLLTPGRGQIRPADVEVLSAPEGGLHLVLTEPQGCTTEIIVRLDQKSPVCVAARL